ncbi:hypothetical protein HOE22_13200 [Candidatus Woesearchaeota archaeon]|jgi:hypothetical protein|nr:hypothetical protein [Candidatus Woesearchaeota archaeon]
MRKNKEMNLIIKYEVFNGHENEIRTIDLNTELSVEEFLPLGWELYTENYLTTENKLGIGMTYCKGKTEHCHLVYLIVIGGKVVKIGGSETGLGKRWGSYNNGRPDIRKGAGNGSVTNYYVTEAIREALNQGYKVEWYVKKMEYRTEELTLYSGEVLSNKIYPIGKYKDHEKDLLTLYESKNGNHPCLSSNS